MASFGNLNLTALGFQAQLQAQGGTPLVFSKIKMGDGNFTGNLTSLTALVSEKVTLDITKGYVQNGAYTVEAYFDNADLTEGFYWREIGVFIQDTSGNDILYAYANAGANYDFIPATTDERYAKYIRVAMAVGNAENVTIVESSGLTYVDTLTFEAKMAEVDTKIETALSSQEGNNLKTYTALTDIGLTVGSETIKDIATNLPNYSMLVHGVTTSNAAIYPSNYGLLTVKRAFNSRIEFRFVSTAGTEYTAFYSINSGGDMWTGWKMTYDENQITYGTADLTAGSSSLATGRLYFVYE